MSETFGLNVEYDGNAEDLANDLASAFERAFGRTMAELQRDFVKIFTGGSAGQRQASRSADRLRKDFDGTAKAAKNVTEEVASLSRRLNAVRLPEQIEQDLLEAGRTARRVFLQAEQAMVDFADNPAALSHFRQISQQAQRATSEIGVNFRQVIDVENTEFRKGAEQKRVIDQGATARARAEASERIVTAQQEGARVVAETRAAGQRRVEIMRFVFNQIRAIERGLGAVFRTTTNAIAASVRGIGGAVGRIGSIFRRTDSQLASGLSGSMTRRESIFRSSLSRQERILQSSVQRQSLQIQRLETRLSRGVAGAVTGRSALGGLLGGGLAIGGGFALIGTLRNLATAGADFTQTMAVLQQQLQVSDKEMQKVRQTALDLGNDISLPGVSAKDAGEAIQILAKQFGALGEGAIPAARNAAKGVLQLSRATRSSAEDSAQVVGAAVNVFGISADKAVQVADQVTGALTKAAGTSFQDFALAFKQGASVFNTFQGGALGAEGALIEFNTALAALARGGLVGSDAGTSLKQFFLQANRGTDAANASLALLTERAGEVGTAFFDQQGNARSLTDTLDILRRGLEGLSEQQRAQILQKIFGSDAIRAADILLKTSDKTFRGIREGIARQGVAAEIAAAQNQGLRGAMDALNSVIETQGIVAYEKINKAAGNVVLRFAELLNQLLTGTGAWKTLRDAIVGATVAIAGLVALRGAIEVVQLLGVAARGLLTPFGILGLAVFGIGAAFNILRQRSPGFRKALDQILTILQTLGEVILVELTPIIEFFQEKFEDLISFITGDATPTIAEFGNKIGKVMVRGVREVADFLKDEVIPRIGEFVDFVKDKVIPAVRDFLVTAFERAREAVQDFWGVVEPILTPAAEAFRDLAEAIGDIKISEGLLALGGVLAGIVAGFVTLGPLGAVVGGLGAAVASSFALGLNDELVAGLSNFGSLIIDTLGPHLESAIEFVKSFFTLDRLRGITASFLDIVEQIGFIIGNIATDPRLLAAAAGIVAAGVTIGVRLVEGIARGVLENFGDVFDVMLEAVGFSGDFDQIGEKVGLLIITGITAVMVGPRVAGALTKAATTLGLKTGNTLGESIAKGAVPGAGQAGFGAGPKGLLQGLIGGPGLQRAIDKDFGKVTTAVQTSIRRMNQALVGAGRVKIDVQADQKGLSQVSKSFQDLQKDIGTARTAGGQFRRALKDLGTAAAVRDIKGVRTAVGDLGASLKGQGRNIGALAGTAIAASIGVAFGAQMALEGEGMADTAIGVGTIIASALTAGAVGGAPLAAVTLLLGGVTTLLQSNQREAIKAKQEMQEYLGTFDEVSGKLSREKLRTTVFENLRDESIDTRRRLADLGFDYEDFVAELEKGEGAGERTFAAMLEGLDLSSDSARTLIEDLRTGRKTLDDFQSLAGAVSLQRLFEEGGVSAERLAEIIDFLNDETGEFGKAAEEAAVNVRLIGGAAEAVGGKMRDAVADRDAFFAAPPDLGLKSDIDGIRVQLFDAEQQAQDATTAIDELFGRGLPTTLRQGLDDLLIGLEGLDEQVKGIDLGTALGRAKVRDAAAEKATEFLEVMKQGIEDGEITTAVRVNVLRERFLENVEKQLRGKDGKLSKVESAVLVEIRGQVEGAKSRKALQKLIDDFAAGTTLSGKVTADELVEIIARLDEAKSRADVIAILKEFGLTNKDLEKLGFEVELPVEVIPSVTTKVQVLKDKIIGAFAGPQGFAGGGGGVGTVALDVPVSVNPIVTVSGSQLGVGVKIVGEIAQGATAATVVLNVALLGVLASAESSANTAASRFIPVGTSLSSALGAGIVGGSDAAASATKFTVGLAAAQAASGAPALYSVGSTLASSFAGGISAGSGSAASAASSMASAAAGAASGYSAYGAGVDLAYGFAGGINDGASAAINAARNMAINAVNAAKSVLQISSPSRVFRRIGRDVGRGLAVGLRESGTDITSAVNEAISDAIEAAQRRLGRIRVARAEAAAALFEQTTLPGRIPGGPTQLDIEERLIEVRDAMASVRDINRDMRRDNAETMREIKAERKELAQRLADIRKNLEERLIEIREGLKERIQAAFIRPEEGLDLFRQKIDLSNIGDQLRDAVKGIFGGLGAEGRLRGLDLQRSSKAGREVINTILDFGTRIRTLGQTMLAQGASAETVAATMRRYREELVSGARSLGINKERLQQLISQLGLSDSALAKFVETSRRAQERSEEANRRAKETAKEAAQRARESAAERIADLKAEIAARLTSSRSLDIGTEAGRRNRQVFTDAFQRIRSFGIELLRSGVGANQTVKRMKAMRNELVAMAKRFGFSSQQIQDLVKMMGLSDKQLKKFIKDIGDLNKEIGKKKKPPPPPPPEEPPPGTVIGPGGRLPPGFRELHVHLPFGDPEAVAASVSNRLAYNMPGVA